MLIICFGPRRLPAASCTVRPAGPPEFGAFAPRCTLKQAESTPECGAYVQHKQIGLFRFRFSTNPSPPLTTSLPWKWLSSAVLGRAGAGASTVAGTGAGGRVRAGGRVTRVGGGALVGPDAFGPSPSSCSNEEKI
jgi:hypothetical protein